MKTDLELIASFTNGKEEASKKAYETLIQRYQSKMYSIALRYTKNAEDAEEVLCDVCMTLYTKLDKFEGKSAFSSWLYRIVVNSALMKLRKNRQEKAVLTDDLPLSAKLEYDNRGSEEIAKTDERSIQHETREALEYAINLLAPEYREVFVLRDVDGLSNSETGEILDLSISAVKSRLHRARLMLRKKLAAYWRDYNGETSTYQAHKIAAAG